MILTWVDCEDFVDFFNDERVLVHIPKRTRLENTNIFHSTLADYAAGKTSATQEDGTDSAETRHRVAARRSGWDGLRRFGGLHCRGSFP